MAIALAFFNQLSGINAVIYYAPRILEGAGLQQSAALLSTVGIGIVNLIFTMFGMALIDRFGLVRVDLLVCLHHVPRHRTGDRYLGVPCGDISKQCACLWDLAWLQYPLYLCRTYCRAIPLRQCTVRWRSDFRVLRWDDGAAVDLRMAVDAGNVWRLA